MVRCSSNALYTGIAKNVIERVDKHNAGKGARAVVMLGLPVVLVYVEEVGSHGDALRREIEIKKLSKTEKEKMVDTNGMYSSMVKKSS